MAATANGYRFGPVEGNPQTVPAVRRRRRMVAALVLVLLAASLQFPGAVAQSDWREDEAMELRSDLAKDPQTIMPPLPEHLVQPNPGSLTVHGIDMDASNLYCIEGKPVVWTKSGIHPRAAVSRVWCPFPDGVCCPQSDHCCPGGRQCALSSDGEMRTVCLSPKSAARRLVPVLKRTEDKVRAEAARASESSEKATEKANEARKKADETETKNAEAHRQKEEAKKRKDVIAAALAREQEKKTNARLAKEREEAEKREAVASEQKSKMEENQAREREVAAKLKEEKEKRGPALRSPAFKVRKSTKIAEPSELPSKGTFTYMMWIKLDDTADDWVQLFQHGNDKRERSPGMWLIPKSTQLHVRSATSLGWNTGVNTPSVTQGEWTHVSITHGEGQLAVFFNGNMVIKRPLPDPDGNSGPLWACSPWYEPASAWLADIRAAPGIATVADINQAIAEGKSKLN